MVLKIFNTLRFWSGGRPTEGLLINDDCLDSSTDITPPRGRKGDLVSGPPVHRVVGPLLRPPRVTLVGGSQVPEVLTSRSWEGTPGVVGGPVGPLEVILVVTRGVPVRTVGRVPGPVEVSPCRGPPSVFVVVWSVSRLRLTTPLSYVESSLSPRPTRCLVTTTPILQGWTTGESRWGER